MILLFAALTGAAEYRLANGGEYSAEFHGVLDVGVRDENWSVELLTDTVDGRWFTEGERGKAWVGGRAAAFAAGLQISPWTDGWPDPDRALGVAYGGFEAGIQRYLPSRFYLGLEGHGRVYVPYATPSSSIEVPPPSPVLHADFVLGWYTQVASFKVRPGVDLASASQTGLVQPHFAAEAQLDPGWTVSPRANGWVQTARDKDSFTRTRLGGLNPYSVPLAGAAWGEFWVEDYGALRSGIELTVKGVEVAPIFDLVWFDGRIERGFGLDSRVEHKRLFVELDAGLAPQLPRPGGHPNWGFWYAIGLDWG